MHSPAFVWPTVLFLGLGFALANGLGYGSGNLRQYLLHALHGLDPTFLAGDWFTTQTRAHHIAFNALIVAAGSLFRLDVFFAVANAAFAVLFVTCIHLLAARFYRTPIVLTTLAVLCWALEPTSLIGMTTIVNSYFQPSTIGAVGLLAGLTCLIYQRYRLAGLVLGTAAFFHINYMVWIVVILVIVTAVNFRALGWRQTAFLVTPAALAAAFHVPFVLAGKSPEQAAYAPEAAKILHDIYMPAHSRPRTWGIESFVQTGMMLAAGGISLIVVGVQRRPGRIALSILGAFAAIVVAGMILTTALQVDLVALLFPCRLAPFLILAAVIATAGAIATTAQGPALSPVRTILLWSALGPLLYCGGLSTYGLLFLGAAATALFAGRLARERSCSAAKMIALLVGLTIALYAGGEGRSGLAFVGLAILGAAGWRAISNARVLLWPAPAAPLLAAVLLMQSGSARKDLLGPPPAAEEQVLFDWCRARTNPTDVFVIPPLLQDFRQGARRPVVIDWKCMPILPKDTVEWYRRLTDECGLKFDALSQAEEGYTSLDADRAERLADAYHARYLVINRNTHHGDLSRLRQVYGSPNFAVFDLYGRAGAGPSSPAD